MRPLGIIQELDAMLAWNLMPKKLIKQFRGDSGFLSIHMYGHYMWVDEFEVGRTKDTRYFSRLVDD